ncbi:hypothetical protein SEPCBS119000_005397 [Sporothrix epigloea]|uniref:Centromere protein Scm3 n=1 Tax=Sporothrix epigloea TaxID=1892477 RepID=A0ABP0DZM5_9PEZI
MDRPTKRAKVGHAPYDAPPLDRRVSATVMANTASSSSKTKMANPAGKLLHDDNEDEIAMDPEDYAMKVDPEYRLDRSRAVAENKLKSAFELLFEKYSQDFGDTGDEVNFYTDEIEVDNGHIASLPANGVHARPRAPVPRPGGYGDEDDEQSSGYESGQNHKPGKPSSQRDASRLFSLLPPCIGPGGTVKMSESAHAGAYQEASPTPGHETIDPAWAVPEIPGLASSTPGGFQPPTQLPRRLYAVPQRKLFRKTLAAGHTTGLGDTGASDDDDLLLDTPTEEHQQGRHGKELGRTASTISKPELLITRQKEPTSAGRARTDTPDSEPNAQILPTYAKKSSSQKATPSPRKGKTASTAAVPDASWEELATNARGSGKPTVTSTVVKSTQTYTRYTTDHISAPSDEEDLDSERSKKPGGTGPVSNDVSVTCLREKDPTAHAKVVRMDEPPMQIDAAGATSLACKGVRVRTKPNVETKQPRQPRNSSHNAISSTEKQADLADRSLLKQEDLCVVITTAKIPSVPEPASADDHVDILSEIDLEPDLEQGPASENTPVPTPSPITPTAHALIRGGAPPQKAITNRSQKRRQRPPAHDAQKTTPLSARSANRREISVSAETNGSGIISLVSDGSADEDDELEMTVAAALPLSARRIDRALSNGKTNPRTPSSRHRLVATSKLMVTPSRQQAYARALSRSPLAHRQKAHSQKENGPAPSPAGSVIQTPGGSLRRCGQDGFRCERDFCFRCT